MTKRYSFTKLAAALERAIKCDVGMKGLDVLMYGFIQKGGVKRTTLKMREKKNGEKYLTEEEAIKFSEYAGYDLTSE
jgi:hypothetical protein